METGTLRYNLHNIEQAFQSLGLVRDDLYALKENKHVDYPSDDAYKVVRQEVDDQCGLYCGDNNVVQGKNMIIITTNTCDMEEMRVFAQEILEVVSDKADEHWVTDGISPNHIILKPYEAV